MVSKIKKPLEVGVHSVFDIVSILTGARKTMNHSPG